MSQFSDESTLLQRFVKIGGILAAVVCATFLGGVFILPWSKVSTFWPPNAILLGSLLLLNGRDRMVCLVLSYPAFVLAELLINFTISQSLGFAAVNCIAISSALWIIVKLTKTPVGFPDLQYLTVVFMATVISSLIGGILGSTWVAVSGIPNVFVSVAIRWSLGDFFGYLVFMPVLLMLREYRDWWKRETFLGRLEALGSMVLVIALSIAAYGIQSLWTREMAGIQFLPIPIMLWMALRFGPKGAAAGSLTVSMIAFYYASNGLGPFSNLSPEQSVFSLQAFMFSIAAATFLVAILTQERDNVLKLLSERDQQQKEARYRALVDLANDAILILDVDAKTIIEANPQAARLIGCESAERVKTLAPISLTPEFQADGRCSEDAMRAHLKEALNGGLPSFQWMIKSCQGKEIPCEMSLARFPDPVRRLVRFSVVDITERVATEKRRMELETQLAQTQKLEAIGQMTGGVAHDFNNLLNIVLGNLELIREQTEDSDKLTSIETAIEATLKGADLTRSMLNFARRAYLNPTVLDLSDVVKNVDKWASRTIPANIKVITSSQNGLWKTAADLSTTENAILNLVINARDAMSDGGTVSITTENATISLPVQLNSGGTLVPGRYVVLTVSDTGIGISAENIESIFDPFFSTKGPGKGSGLGLSMIQGFMEQSGGGVLITSELDKGTDAKLYFKACAETKKEVEQLPIRQEEFCKKSARILLVEDERAVNELLLRALREAGHEVVNADTGDQALKVFRSDRGFDLLISDIVMPGEVQGPELAMELRQLKPELRVIFISGYDWGSRLSVHDKLKDDTRLMKPVSLKILLSAVQKALSQSEPVSVEV